jgi:hypothetical protein
MDHASRAAAAAEDDAVGVALYSVQHLSVTDHRRSFRRLRGQDKCGKVNIRQTGW